MSKKRFLAILLSFTLLLQCMPMNVFAEGGMVLSNEVPLLSYGEVKFYRAAADENGNPTLTEGELTYELITTQYVEDGAEPEFPDIPDVNGYETIGWETTDGGATYYARYSAIGKYTVEVKFVYSDGVTSVEPTQSYDIDIAQMETMDDLSIKVATKAGFDVKCVDEAGNEIDVSSGSFEVLVKELTGNKTYTVTYAGKSTKYFVEHYVQNLNGEYELKKTEEYYGIAGTLTQAAPSPDYNVEGFVVVDFDSEKSQTNINPSDEKDGDDELTVIEIKYDRLTYTLSYDTDGGTYLDTEVLMYGAPVKIPAVSKQGYTFNGWNAIIKKDDGTTSTATYDAEASFTMPAGDVVLSATWTAAESATYTVIYWQQSKDDKWNAEPKTYDYVTSKTKTGKPGTTTSFDALTKDELEDYSYCTLDSSASLNTTIKADGSTIVNVYYNREIMTLTFKYGNTYNAVFKGLYGQSFEQAGYTWPADYKWVQDGTSTTMTFMEAFTMQDSFKGNLSITFNGSAKNTTVIKHYRQNVDGENWEEDPYLVYAGSNSTLKLNNKFEGFTVAYFRHTTCKWSDWCDYNNHQWRAASAGESAGNTSHGIEVRHTRNKYTLSFNKVKDGALASVLLPYEQKLSVAMPTTPEDLRAWYPSEAYAGYTFGGWYYDDGYQKPVDWTQGMPTHNVPLYARWIPPMQTVTYYLNYKDAEGNDAGVHASYTVYKKDMLSAHHYANGSYNSTTSAYELPSKPSRTGYTFEGWYTDSACTMPLVEDFANTQIVKDWSIYAKWLSVEEKEASSALFVVNSETEIKVLNPETGEYEAVKGPTAYGKVGETVTLEAVDIPGYLPVQKYVTHTISANPEENVVKIEYILLDTWTLVVNYVKKGSAGEEDVLDSQDVLSALTANTKAVEYKVLTGGTDENGQQYIWLVDNTMLTASKADAVEVEGVKTVELTFYYTKAYQAPYTTEYYLQNTDGSYPATASSVTTLYGWTGYTAETEPSAPENYRFDSDNANNRLEATILRDGSTVLKVYYELNVHTVTYQPGDHGSLNGAKENIVHEGILYGAATPAAPTVTADEGYYFTGWDKTIAATVTEDVVYTAQYEAKTDASLTVKDVTVIYNGSAQTNTESVVKSVLKDGHTWYYTYNRATGTDADTYAGSYNEGVTIKDANGNDVSYQYNISIDVGYLTISPRKVTLTSATDSKNYDGTPLTNKNVTVGGDGFVSGEGASYNVTGSQTEAGSSANSFTYTLNNGTKADNYTISTQNGTLTVNKANTTVVKIIGNTATKVYNGSEQTVEGYTVEKQDDTITVSFNGNAAIAKGTNVGTYYMGLTKEMFSASSPNYENIVIEVVDGSLNITPITEKATVTITGNTATKVYTGSEQSVEGYKASVPDNTVNVSFKGNAVAKGTNVGTYYMGLTKEMFTATSANYTNIEIVVNDGWLEITPITDEVTVTITGHTATKVYTGSEQTVEGYEVSVPDSTVNVSFSGTAVAKGTNVGTYDMGLTKEMFTATSANYTNIEIVVNDGWLEITPITEKATVTITGNTATKVYTGSEQSVEGYKVSVPDNTVNVSFNGNAIAKGTNVGTYNMGLTKEMFTATSANYTNIEIVVKDGWLEITPITDEVTVTITGKTDSQVYDGTEKTVTGYTFSADNALYLESYVNFTGKAEAKRTDVGTTMMNLTVAQFTNISSNFSNVTFVVNDGWMKITPVTDEVVVTIVGNNDSKMYNGQVQSVEGYEITNISNNLYSSANVQFTGTAKAERTDTGTTQMGLTEGMFTNGNANFSNVKFIVTDGYMTIIKRSVTLTSGDATGIYNGQPLTKSDITTSGDGWATGEGADCAVIGSQTEVGSSPNEFTYTLIDGTKADNYNINTVFGTLTVTALTDEVIVTITENSGSEKYDGSEKTVTGYKVTSISNSLYKTSDFTFSGDATVKGTDAGTYDMKLVPENFTNTSKNITNVKFVIVDGTLEITKREVTLTSADDSKVYDGKALTNDNVTVGGDGWASGEGATYSVTGNQTAKGESPNAFTYTLNANTKAENYDITKVEGTLKVTDLTDKVTVTITENSGTEKYDGTEKTVEGYTVSISNSLYTVNDFVFTGNKTVTGTDAGTYDMLLKPADFENKSANFTNVEFVIKDGTLVIEKRAVTLTSATKEKVYDGTPLTDNNVTVGGEGFATGEGATCDVTGTQTEVGESDNTFTYTLNNGTKADNYAITTEEGTLKVTPVTDKVTVTITENSGTEKYDGSEKTVTGYKVTSISNPLYTEKDFTFSGDAEVKGTDAGTYDMQLKPEDFNNISKNFSDVEFKIVDGTLEITKREVTLTSATDSREYNGNALTNGNVTVTGEGFATGEGATWNVTGSQTLVGSSENEFTYTLNEGTKAGNYEIKTVFGKLTVTDRTAKYEITVEANSGEYLYDGKEHTAEGFKTLTFTVEGNTYTVEGLSASVTETNAGEYDNEITGTAVVKDANGNDVTAQFIVNETDGKLVINKRTVTMTSADAEKTYDGTPLTKDEVNESGDGFVSGEGATYDVKGSQTAVGESPNTFTYTLKEGTKADNYTITTVEGTLKVTEFNGKIEVTITENKGTFKYDGTEKKVENYTVSINTTLYTEADFEFQGNAVVTGTDAGTYDMELKPENFKNISKNFKDEDVTFKIVDGTLVIEKRVVTLTSDDDEKVYDGKALTNDTVTVTGDGWADKEGATYNVTGSQLNEGSSDNTFTYTLNNGTKADNYNINTVFGTLTVTALTDEVVVTITENSGSEKYDGSEKTVTGYTVTSISNDLYKVSDFTFSGDATVKGTDAGTYDMQLKSTDFANISKNFSNVEFVIVDGKLEITKRVVTLTSADDEKVYDGKVLTNDTVTVGGEGFATGEGATCDVTGTQTEVGESDNTFTYTLNNGTKADNYTITTTAGTLTITPVTDKVTVTITENSGSEKYDGTEKTVTGYTVTSISNPLYKTSDFTFSGTDSVSGINVDTYEMQLEPVNFTNISENFTNVEFVIVDGKLEITKRSVTLTSADDSKMYDGQPLTNDTVTVTGDRFVGSEGATYDVTGTQTEVGSSANNFTYELKEGTLAGNYDITVEYGTLTVTELTDEVVVTITEHSGSYTYDGSEKTVTGYDVKIDNPLYTEADFSFNGEATIKGTEAGSYPMELTAADFTNNSENFSKVTFVIVDGTLEIAKKEITITANTDKKTYDGKALTNAGYESTDLASGDKFESVTVTGSQLDVGSSENVASEAVIFDENGKDVTASYDIKYVDGTLTVEKKAITITADDGSKEYDGTALVVNDYKGSDLAEGDEYDSVTVTGSQLKVGSSDNVPSAAKIINADGKDVTGNYNITYVNGKLTVTQSTKELKVVANTNEWSYDGAAHADNGYKVIYNGIEYTPVADGSVTIATGDTITATITKTVTNVEDTAAGNNEIVELVVENADQYEKITKVPGTLTIKPIDVIVTIKGNYDTAVYDGTEHEVKGYTATADTKLYDVEKDFDFSGNATASRIEVGTSNMGLAPDQFKNKNTNFANVTFQVSDGYQRITPIDEVVVTITGHNNTTDYDGEAHTVTGYDVEISNPLYNVTDFTFSGKAEAVRTDAGTNVMGLNADQFKNINENFKTVTFNVTDGYQTINPIDVTVTITEHSDEVDYDGNKHTVTGYDVEIANPLYTEEDFTFSGTDSVSGTDAGAYDMELKPEDFENTNNNFATVTFEIVDGQLVINPIDVTVTITEHSDKVTYDGKDHTVTGYDVEIANPLYTEEDFTFSGTDSVSGTDAGTYDMELKPEDFENTNNNFATVTFVIVDGQLVINPIDVTVTIVGASNTTEYDGTEHEVKGYTATASTELYDVTKDFTFSATAEAARKNVGTTNMGLDADQFANTNPNFKTVTFEVTDGYQTITKKPLTITADSNEKQYDGKALTDDGYTSTELATDDAIESVKVVGSIIFEGTVPNEASEAVIMDGEEDVTANYDIEYVDGTLEIFQTTKELKVVANSHTWTYDSENHADGGYTVTYGDETYTVKVSESATLSTGDTVTATIGKVVKNVTDTKPGNNEIVELVIGNAEQYANVVTENGTLTILPLEITFTAANDEKEYDGTPLTNNGYTPTTIENGDVIKSVTVTGSITEVGEMANVPSDAKIMDGDEDVTDNYTIKYVNGLLVIKPSSDTLVVTANTNTWEYDGEYHADGGYTVTYKGEKYVVPAGGSAELSTGDKVTAKIDAKVKNVTDSVEDNNVIVELIVENEKQYASIAKVPGTLSITRKPVTITAEDAEKEYDGTALTKNAYTATALAGGDTFKSVTITGSITNVGTEPNIPSAAVILDGEEDVTANYDIKYVDGTLEIYKTTKELKVVANSNSWEYDSENHADGGYTVTYGDENYTVEAGKSVELSTGDTVTATIKKVVKNVADSIEGNNEIVELVVENSDQYAKITPVAGTLSINKKALTITADSNEKQYDGTALTDDGFTADGLAEGDKAVSAVVEGSQTLVGSSANKASDAVIKDGEEDVTANYDIKYVEGTLTVTEPKDHSLVIVKTHAGREYMVGETVEFVITVKNIFADARTITITEIEGVTITGKSVFEAVAPDTVVKTTAEYVITDADVIALGFTNTATATFTGSDVEYKAQDEVETVEPTSELIVTKTEISKPADENGYALGETIKYALVVKNTANLTVDNIVLTDELTKFEKAVGTLAMGESSETFTTEYVVTSDDILTGKIINTAVVTGVDADKQELTDSDTVTVVTADVDDSLTVTKVSDVKDDETVSLGDVITYTITVTNDGNVPFYNVVVTDEWTGDEWTIETLAVGETQTFTATYTVASSDILAGKVVNEVTAEADEIQDPKNPENPKTPEDDDDVTDETDDVNYKLTVVKTSDTEGKKVALGETITYTITVTNDGNVPFHNVKVVDEWTGDEWTIEVLAVGETETFTATHVVTSDDILKGEVVNSVTAEADEIQDPKDPENPKTPEDDDDVTDETDDVNYKLTVVKTSDTEGEKVALGETITYTITVTNDGNVPFYNVKVVDEWTGDEWTIEVLAVGETETFTATYVVTSDDILKGEVVNSVTAEADEIQDPKDPENPKTPEDDDDVTDETDDVDSGLIVTKTSKVPGGDTAGLGEVIEYTITVTNDGNVPFYNVVVTDEWTGDVWTIEVLAVGESVIFETSYTVTSDDVLAGKVVNEVTATADPIDDPKDPENPKTPEDDDKIEDETDDVNPAMSVKKVSDVADGDTVSLGDVITYTITVTNDGNVPYYNVEVVDEMTGGKWTIEVLEVGETESFTTTYTVTSDDILAGSIVNKVTVEGDPIDDPKDPEDPKKPEGGDDEEDETDDVDATLTVTKVSDVKDGETVSLGDVITYTIVVKNDGNVPFNNVKVVDQLDGAEFVPGAAYQIDANGNAIIKKLAVGTAVTLTAKYTVTSDDILNGFVLNEVTAEADPIDDPKNPDTPKTPEDDDNEKDETDDVNAAMEVVKTSDVAEGEKVVLGDTINYTIVVKNLGNVPYYNVVVTDEWTEDEWTIEVLAVGESVTFETSYIVTSDDILAGKVVNEVIATADPIDDPKNPDTPKTPEDDDEEEDETDDVNAAIEVIKTSDVKDGETVSLGETINYTIVVKNIGNVPYYNVVVTDEWTEDEWTIEVLAVGESVTLETSYTVTSDDILAGKVVNEVTVTADPIDDPKNPDTPKTPEDDDDEEDETDDVDAAIEVIKTSDVKEGETVSLGETITYTITVTNKGNVPFSNVDVVDEWTGDEWTIAVLAVGESKTFTATYVVTEADLIKGSVLNEVTVEADPIDDPKNPDVPKTPEDDDDVEDPTDATKPSLFITKKTVSKPANGESYALGETIAYEITVLNNGNLTITDIVVTDELTGDVWTIDKLEVGEMSSVLKTEYVVTEADIIKGSVLNSATATGKTEDPDNPEPSVTPGDVVDPTDEADAAFELVKTLVNLPEKGYFTVNEKAVYEIVVKNTGNLTVTNVVVTEDLEGAVFVSADSAKATVSGNIASITSIEPGESVTLRAEYVIKIEDLSTELKNFVSGTADGPKDPDDPDRDLDPDDENEDEKTPVDELVIVAGNKIWDDVDNAYGTRPESITVHLFSDGAEIRKAVITEEDGWKFSFDMLPEHNTDGTKIVYSVTEDAITGYNTAYAEEGYDITNSLTEHKLTINYWYYEIGGEPAYETYESIRKYGEPYDVASPNVIGHSPDVYNIVGVITEDVSYDVIYTRNKYKLVIEYMYLDGTYVWPRHTEILYYEDPYERWSPELEGYTPNYKLIKGDMPAYDLYFKVIYVPDETDIIIDEYGVPLGVGTVEMNMGECFE